MNTIRHNESSSAVLDRMRPLAVARPMDTSTNPFYDDNSRDIFRYGEWDMKDRRTDYYHLRVNRSSDEAVEGGFARHRADNNYSNLAKFAGLAGLLQGASIGGVTGAGLGAVASSLLKSNIESKLSPTMKAVVKRFAPKQQKLLNDIRETGALAGGTIGATSGGMAGLFNSDKRASEDEAHAYITDVGVTVFPKKLGPADLTYAFHMNNPLAKYYPALSTLAGVAGSVALDVAQKKTHTNIPRLVALSTLGGGLGTLAKLYSENKYLEPYKKGYVKTVENKYGRKMANSTPVMQEYITETNIEALPFHDTAPPDLETAYKFKHPFSVYAPALGTLAGAGGTLAYGALKKKPLMIAPALISGTMGGAIAAVAEQIHKDTVLQRFKAPVVDEVNKKYKQLH